MKKWNVWREKRKRNEEMERMARETEKKFKESREEMERMSREADKKFNEKMERISKEADKKFNEKMERMARETEKKLNKISGIFSSQWGKLMEALIEPACLKLFKSRNIDVTRTQTNTKIKRQQEEAEFDIILTNGTEVVIVEVKTDMTVNKIDHFIEKLSRIKIYIPELKNKKVYGAVAGIKYSEQSDKYAYRKGLFVLRNSGDYVIEIANPFTFKPYAFG